VRSNQEWIETGMAKVGIRGKRVADAGGLHHDKAEAVGE
jgi:hypothetical protein